MKSGKSETRDDEDMLDRVIASAGLLVCATMVAQTPISHELTSIKTFFEHGLERNGIVGSGLALVRGNEVVGEDFYGFARRGGSHVDENTAFHWASITKTFTGIAIMQLRDHGLLTLDDPVVKYVPELAAVHDPWGPIDAITIREVMSHSSGFRAATWPWRDKPWQPFEPTQWSQAVAMLPYTDVEFPPGSRYSYSNLAVVFLGQIIQRLSGDDYEVYVDKNILKPLRMYASYFDKSPYYLLKNRSASYTIAGGKLIENPFNFDTGITVSNGGLNSPIADMVKYIEFLLGAPSHDEVYDEVLKRSSLEEMWRPVIATPSDGEGTQSLQGERNWAGLSFFIHDSKGRRFIGHGGDQNGFISHFYIEPKSKAAYVVAFNTDATDSDRNTHRFERQLRDYLFEHFF